MQEIRSESETNLRNILQQSLPDGIVLHSLNILESGRGAKASVFLDKPADKYGSVTIGECESVARMLSVAADSGRLPANLEIEVSSAGAEREISVPGELQRFSELPLRVLWTSETGTMENRVIQISSIGADALEAKLAKVRINRTNGRMTKRDQELVWKIPFSRISKVQLHIDF